MPYVYYGDNYYRYTCPKCAPPDGAYARYAIGWCVPRRGARSGAAAAAPGLTRRAAAASPPCVFSVGRPRVPLIQFILYQLMCERQRKREAGDADVPDHAYFRWREDICSFLDRHWDTLTPGKARTPTWGNTIASYLSIKHAVYERGARGAEAVRGGRGGAAAHCGASFLALCTRPRTSFQTGASKFNEPGWWTLHTMEPPRRTTQEVLPTDQLRPPAAVAADTGTRRVRSAPAPTAEAAADDTPAPARTKRTKPPSGNDAAPAVAAVKEAPADQEAQAPPAQETPPAAPPAPTQPAASEAAAPKPKPKARRCRVCRAPGLARTLTSPAGMVTGLAATGEQAPAAQAQGAGARRGCGARR